VIAQRACGNKSRVHTKALSVLNAQYMMGSVYSLNFRMNFGTMVNGVLVCLWHNFHWSYDMMIIELRWSIRVIVQFPVELWYDGHRVVVVYKSNGTISGGAMAQFPVELWHKDHRVAVVYKGYCTISCGAIVRWSQSCSCL